jgi:hypothetical protein
LFLAEVEIGDLYVSSTIFERFDQILELIEFDLVVLDL